MIHLNSHKMQSHSYTGEVISFITGLLGYVLYEFFGLTPGFMDRLFNHFELPLLEIGITVDDMHSVFMAIVCAACGFFTHLFLKWIIGKIKKVKFKLIFKRITSWRLAYRSKK